MENLSNLNKQYICGEVLSDEDLNLLVAFINGIINYLNNTVNPFIELGGTPGLPGLPGKDGKDGNAGKDGKDGDTPYIKNGNWWIGDTDTGVSVTHESGFNYSLLNDPLFTNLLAFVLELQNLIDALNLNLGSGSSYDLNLIVNTVIGILRNWNWGEIINNLYFDELLLLYLTEIGLILLDGEGNTTTISFSQIIQRLNSIEAIISNLDLGTDPNTGNQLTLQQITASVIAELKANYGFAGLKAVLEDWPATLTVNNETGETIANPTIFSALSETNNKVEKNEAGLEAIYQQYAGVISLDAYTASLILGLANELMAKTTISSAFGEYFTAQDGLPVYDTWNDGISGGDGSPVYETDAYGRAIPYTGIVLRYIRYEDENHLVINDPDAAVYTKIVSDPNDASYTVKKVVRTDNNGNPVKDLNNNILYDLVVLKDKNGLDLRKQEAFKVYYRSNVIDSLYDSNDPPDPRTYSYGRYGLFAGHNYFYFEENFNSLFTAENGEVYDYSTHPLYMGNLQKYTAADITALTTGNGIYASTELPPYIKEGEIKWGTPTSGDYNDGHYDSNGQLIGVVFIKNYGPDKIAYHKVRKMKIKSTSGIITLANMDSAFATVFAQQGLMYSAIVNMTTNNAAFVSAVASAAANLTDTALATAKMIADASMYLARTLYKYDTGNYDGGGNPIYAWLDIATEEEEYLYTIYGNPFNISYLSTASSYLYNNDVLRDPNTNEIITRIKPNGSDIEWVQDTVYVYGGKEHTFKLFKNDWNSITGNYYRKNLYIRSSDGIVVKEGDSYNNGNSTYSESQLSSSSDFTPKKKLIEQITSGIINTVDLADDYAMSQLFAKIESDVTNDLDGRYAPIASITAVVRRKEVNGNPVQASEVRVENNNNVTYYLYRNKSSSPITVDGTLYQSGGLFWIDVPYTSLENDSDYSSIFSNVEPIYELESNITLTADLINLIAQKGEVYINNLASDSGFINTLTSNIINTGNITANSVYIKSYDDTDPSNVIEYNIALDPNNGYYNYYEVGTIQNEIFTAHSNSRVDVNHIYTSGSGYLAKGNIYWESNGYTRFKGTISNAVTVNGSGTYNGNNYNETIYETVIQPEVGLYLAIGHKDNTIPNSNWIYEETGPNYINFLNKDGSGFLARKNISWDVNGNTTFKGIIYNSDVESLSPAITIDGTDYYYMLNENVMDPDIGFYLAVAYKETNSDPWEYFGGKDYSGTDTDYTNLISMDGSGFLAKGNICWDKDGNTTFKGTVNGTIKVSSFYQQYLNLSGSSDGDLYGVINLNISRGTYIIAQVADSNYSFNDSLGLCASKIIIPDPNNAPNVTLTIVAPTTDGLTWHTWIYPVIRAASGTFFYTKKDYSGTNSGYYRLLSFMLVPNLVVKLHSIGGGWYLDTDENYITAYSTLN